MKREVCTVIFSLAMMYKNTKRQLDRARTWKSKISDLTKVLKQLQIIDKETMDDCYSKYYQLNQVFKAILRILS